MADPELVQTLDYILNRCDESAIDVLAEAVVRRRRELTLMGGAVNIPNPQRMAKEISEQISAGVGGSIEGLKKSIQDMTMRIIRQQAPELTDEQVEELTRAWVPDANGGGEGQGVKAPRELMASMIDQFVAFSQGTMDETEDKILRDEMGAWPERYWKAFSPVIRLIITDFIKDKITEEEFNSKIGIALGI
ncbi:hypothetical protein AGMMS50293_14920 [Spirochaetia bacterium]|nr:hypothetical protein AGMMS50293_14920 [Spirochaetia bacterium]